MATQKLSWLVAGVLALGVTACGTPQIGEKCNAAGFFCNDNQTAMECKVGLWVPLPCRGPQGCKQVMQTITCDMTANQEGDACASSVERKGICTSDGKGTLECQDGTLKKTNTCRSCAISGDQVVCQP